MANENDAALRVEYRVVDKETHDRCNKIDEEYLRAAKHLVWVWETGGELDDAVNKYKHMLCVRGAASDMAKEAAVALFETLKQEKK